MTPETPPRQRQRHEPATDPRTTHNREALEKYLNTRRNRIQAARAGLQPTNYQIACVWCGHKATTPGPDGLAELAAHALAAHGINAPKHLKGP